MTFEGLPKENPTLSSTGAREKSPLHLFFLNAPPSLLIREHISASTLTTFGVGGSVEILLEPQDLESLLYAKSICREQRLGNRTLGAGSNVVVSDNGMPEPVIRLGKPWSHYQFLREEPFDFNRSTKLSVHDFQKAFSDLTTDELPESDAYILAYAGASVMGMSRKLSSSGFSGLEFAAGIPASIGGALTMNAGAHGNSLAEVALGAILVNEFGELTYRSRSDLEFRYRHSNINQRETVLAAILRLHRGNPEQILELRSRCLEYRRRTQPLHLPSAGSVFRNPERIPEDFPWDFINNSPSAPSERVAPAAAQLLESVGVKGLRSGGIEYSSMHANWLVRSKPEALAKDVSSLIERGQSLVKEKFRLELKPEIILW